MIKRFLGLQNSGKTLGMTESLFFDYLSGRVIFTNYNVNFPHYKINQDFIRQLAKEQKDLKNCSFGLDEYWLWMSDARKSMSDDNIESSYVLLQTSKNDINVYVTAQTDSQDDKRIRDNAHYVVECERVLINEDGKPCPIVSDRRILDLPDTIKKRIFIHLKIFKRLIFGFGEPEDKYIQVERFKHLYNTKEKIVRNK